jgi:hypothetical protein
MTASSLLPFALFALVGVAMVLIVLRARGRGLLAHVAASAIATGVVLVGSNVALNAASATTQVASPSR